MPGRISCASDVNRARQAAERRPDVVGKQARRTMEWQVDKTNAAVPQAHPSEAATRRLCGAERGRVRPEAMTKRHWPCTPALRSAKPPRRGFTGLQSGALKY